MSGATDILKNRLAEKPSHRGDEREERMSEAHQTTETKGAGHLGVSPLVHRRE